MKNLEIVWTVSRAKDTEGHNICTLIDYKQKYKTCGGGYDMTGTVFAQWLQANHMDRIKELLKPIDYDKEGNEREGCFYGFFTKGGSYWLDGGCGINAMISLAEKIGFKIETCYKNKVGITNILIDETIQSNG